MIVLGYVYFPISMSFHRDGNLLATGEMLLCLNVKLYSINNNYGAIIFKFLSEQMVFIRMQGF